jgi:hypothetical protein
MVMTETQELVVGAKGLDLNGDVAMDTDSAAPITATPSANGEDIKMD